MENRFPEVIYTVEDVNKAFSMGLESAVVVLENALFLSRNGQRQLIDLLKERIEQDKLEAISPKRSFLKSLKGVTNVS